MKQLIYDPIRSGPRMKIVCFVSGSGTNYARIALTNPDHDYLVFTNRPGCGGAELARQNNHELVELSHVPYLREVRRKYGPGKVPRNCPERETYDREVSRLLEDRLQQPPDLVCLAGYDQLTTDWLVDRYHMKILNVHPGDTTRGYAGLGWIASARAILAGDETVRSTLFLVDKSMDKGPILVQSRPLRIVAALAQAENKGSAGLLDGLVKMKPFVGMTYTEFQEKAGVDDKATMKLLGDNLQSALKIAGDWEIYPYGVRLIARGEVAVDERTVYINGKKMPEYGYRMENAVS
jgi:folate-dependent phosphoribosylglycinamide formyltransferase PurN